MKTQIVIGKHAAALAPSQQEDKELDRKKVKSKRSKELESSEDILKSYDSLKEVIEEFLKESLNEQVVDLVNYRISIRIKANERKRPIALRDGTDFDKLIEVVNTISDQEDAKLIIKVDSKEKKHHKKNKKEKRKRFNEEEEEENSDEDIENKKKQIKSLAELIESSKQQMKGLQSELNELKDLKSNEIQLTGLMNSVSLDSQPKEENASSFQTVTDDKPKRNKERKDQRKDERRKNKKVKKERNHK